MNIILYLDETSLDSHDTARIVWSDGTEEWIVLWIVLCHAGSIEGFIPNSLLFCGKNLSELYADYYDDMNGDVFKDWLENTLLKTYRQAGRFLQWCITLRITVDFLKRRQQWIWKKPDMISFVTKHHIEIPSPLLVKTVLLKKIREANIPKKICHWRVGHRIWVLWKK